MAIGHLNYRDLSPDKRAEAATKLRAQLRTQLTSSTLTSEQRFEIQTRLKHLNMWVAGTIAPPGNPPVVRTPQNHSVGVGEFVGVNEKV
jgi:hypothetical protein